MNGDHRPLVITAETELLDDLLGAAAAVGVAVDVAVEARTCRPQWTTAPLVLVGADLASSLPGAGLPARPAVLLVARGSPGDETWTSAARAGAEDVISLPAGEAALLERLADVAEPADPARVVGVVPGRGGAGGSVLAAAVALAAASRHGAAWLIDLDPLGGGADTGLGAELDAGARWADLEAVAGRVSNGALRGALPEVCGVAVLSCDRRSTDYPAPAALRAVLAAARRGGGTVVLDLPRQPSAARDEALAAAHELVLVVPAEVRAVLAARQVIHRIGTVRPALRMVVRTVPGGLPPHEVARGLGLPLAGALGDEPAVRAALMTGEPRDLVRGTALAELCGRILDELATAGRAA